MSSNTHDCPKCQRKMEPGHIPDVGYGSIMQTSWAAGLPVKRSFIGGIKYDKKAQLPLIAYRCPRCGYVEMYAEGF